MSPECVPFVLTLRQRSLKDVLLRGEGTPLRESTHLTCKNRWPLCYDDSCPPPQGQRDWPGCGHREAPGHAHVPCGGVGGSHTGVDLHAEGLHVFLHISSPSVTSGGKINDTCRQDNSLPCLLWGCVPLKMCLSRHRGSALEAFKEGFRASRFLLLPLHRTKNKCLSKNANQPLALWERKGNPSKGVWSL